LFCYWYIWSVLWLGSSSCVNVRFSHSVIQTDNIVVLTYFDQSTDIRCHRAAHNSGSQANCNHVQGTRLKVPLSHCEQQVIDITSVNLIYLQFVVLPSSTSKSPFTVSRTAQLLHHVLGQGCRDIYGDEEDNI
jgi:hypothetical protein